MLIGETINAFFDAHPGHTAIQCPATIVWKDFKEDAELSQNFFDVYELQSQFDLDEHNALGPGCEDIYFHVMPVAPITDTPVGVSQLDIALAEEAGYGRIHRTLGETAKRVGDTGNLSGHSSQCPFGFQALFFETPVGLQAMFFETPIGFSLNP